MAKINYGLLLNDALRTVVREALIHARVNGLGEDGCFHITFRTRGTNVSIPDFLRLRYPDTMTIVLQWTFSNLNVSDTGFGVTLTFDGRPYYIQVPFSEMTEFKDLSSEFMLQFQTVPANLPESNLQELPLEEKTEIKQHVLSMDEFRRKKNQ
jgi:uncharacterized protein